MNKKLNSLLAFFALSFAFICSMACKLGVDEAKNTEPVAVTINPAIEELSRTAYPDYGNLQASNLTTITLKILNSDDEVVVENAYSSMINLYNDKEIYLVPGTYRFEMTAKYRDANFSGYTITQVSAGTNNQINIVLSTKQDKGSIEIKFNFGAEIDTPEMTTGFIILNTNEGGISTIDIEAEEITTTVNTRTGATVWTLSKEITEAGLPMIYLYFKDADNNLYRHFTKAYLSEGFVSKETTTVNKFFKGYPITYHMTDGTDEVEYYATTYGYDLYLGDEYDWYNNSAKTDLVEKIHAAPGEESGAKEFYQGDEIRFVTIEVVDEDDEVLTSYEVRSNKKFMVTESSVIIGDNEWDYEPATKTYWEFYSSNGAKYNYDSLYSLPSNGKIYRVVKSYYQVTFVNTEDTEEILATALTKGTLNLANKTYTTSEGTYTPDYYVRGYYYANGNEYSASNIIGADTTIYVRKNPYYTVSVVNQYGTTLCSGTAGYSFKVTTNSSSFTLYCDDVSLDPQPYGSNAALDAISLDSNYSAPMTTGSNLVIGADVSYGDVTIYVRIVEYFTEEITLNYGTLYRIPVEGTNCRYHSKTSGTTGYLVGDYVYYLNASASCTSEDTYTTTLKFTIDDSTQEYAASVPEVVTDEAAAARNPYRRQPSNVSEYEITDANAIWVPYTYTLEAERRYYLYSVNSYNRSSWLSSATYSGFMVVDSTGKLIYSTSYSDYNFTPSASGEYTVYAVNRNYSGALKTGHCLWSYYYQKPSFAVSVDSEGLTITSSYDEVTNAYTLTVNKDFPYYKWAIGSSESEGISFSKSCTIYLDNYEVSDGLHVFFVGNDLDGYSKNKADICIYPIEEETTE